MDFKSKIFLISGPTASGKSAFAIKLAKKINGEIINADSMQVYKELKILTARLDPKKYQKIKHHLYGFQSVKKNFSTGDWLKLAVKKIKELKKRKKTPIFVGGTGLYFKALTDGLVEIPKIPIEYRKKVRNIHKTLGQKKFFQQLLKLDPQVQDMIDMTDSQRSIRAYEVKKFTKKSIYKWFKETKPYFKENDFFKIYIDFPRQELVKRIDTRTKKMIKIGAIEEVKKFNKLKIRKDKSANKIIGVNEIRKYLNNEKKLSEIKEKISVKTRQYAKRQRTWARGQMREWNIYNYRHLNKVSNFIRSMKNYQ